MRSAVQEGWKIGPSQLVTLLTNLESVIKKPIIYLESLSQRSSWLPLSCLLHFNGEDLTQAR